MLWSILGAVNIFLYNRFVLNKRRRLTITTLGNSGTSVGYLGQGASRREQSDMTPESRKVDRESTAAARQRFGKHFETATNTETSIEELLILSRQLVNVLTIAESKFNFEFKKLPQLRKTL
jgi:hypothetical protein